MTRIIRLLFVIIAAGGIWCLTAGMQPDPAAAAERRLLWQSRSQFVALEPQDAGVTGPAPPNEHPATVTGEQLATQLAALQFRATEHAATEPLFNRETLEILVPQLLLGLRQATPGEDLTFAVISLHEALYGLAREPRVTTGRVFITDGRLNLIVGLVRQDVNEMEDRRLAPFIPGSRKTVASGRWLLQTPLQPPGFTLSRRDWATVAIGWQPLTAPQQPSPAITPQSPPQLQSSPPPRDPARSPAERLTTLNELKDKGLITDEEYRSKRLQIINEL